MHPTGSIAHALSRAVEASRALTHGAPARYIPELAHVDLEQVSAAVTLVDGTRLEAGDVASHRFTLQSSAKVVLLAGMLEELGEERIFATVGEEPSGASFSSIVRLELQDPRPANPLINAGAIALSSLIPGDLEAKLAWITRWAERLYGEPVAVNTKVRNSEQKTGDRNRSIAYFLKSAGTLASEVDETLTAYFSLCSLEAGVGAASRLAAVLANGGRAPGSGLELLSARTASSVVALMATCGMYDESGSHLLATGLPAKSGVSGIIVAVATGRAGLAVASPRVNSKGGSVRGHAILRQLSRELGWHFAL